MLVLIFNSGMPGDDASDSSASSTEQQEEPIFGSNVLYDITVYVAWISYFYFSQTDVDERTPAARLREALPSLADASAFPSLASFETRESFDLLHFRAKACWVR